MCGPPINKAKDYSTSHWVVSTLKGGDKHGVTFLRLLEASLPDLSLSCAVTVCTSVQQGHRLLVWPLARMLTFL